MTPRRVIAHEIVLLALTLLLIPTVGHPQLNSGNVYHLPFASVSNAIELTVENASQFVASNVKVKGVGIPSWIHLEKAEFVISEIKPKKERTVEYRFDVDKAAPVKREENLTFVISASDGSKWTKEIAVSVSPPDRFELYQNYPNPFNPTTKFDYQLARPGRVLLIVYNLLGQEVARPVDQLMNAGYHSATWDASLTSSGLYYARVIIIDETGNEVLRDTKKILLMK